jgi:hypothetical protein
LIKALVEADGFFMSRKLADERGGCPTTASTASMLVEAPLRRTQQWARDMLEAYGEAWALADSAHRVKARAALAWGAALTDDECMASEYLYNVRTLALYIADERTVADMLSALESAALADVVFVPSPDPSLPVRCSVRSCCQSVATASAISKLERTTQVCGM